MKIKSLIPQFLIIVFGALIFCSTNAFGATIHAATGAKAIKLKSENGPEKSFINCNGNNSGVKVNTGEFYANEKPDFAIKGRGFNLTLTRRYRSKLNYNGPFGFGWVSEHDQKLMFNKEGNILYHDHLGNIHSIKRRGNSGYSTPAGVQYSIKKQKNQYVVSQFNNIKLTFSDKGLLIKKTDNYGNYLAYKYSDDNLIKVTDSLGRSLSFEYNKRDKIINATDFSGRSCTYQYDGDDLIRYTDLEGNVTTHEYLKNHNMSRYTNPKNDSLKIFYNKNDKASHHTNDKGETFFFEYSAVNKFAVTHNKRGYYRKVFFNKNADIVSIDDEHNNLITYKYDSNRNKIKEIDAKGNTTTFTYDSKGNITSRTNALGETWAYAYDLKVNKPSKITDPMGNTTRMEYDANGSLVKKIDALNKVTNFKNDRFGNIIKVTDALNNSRVMVYDEDGLNLIEKRDKNGNTTTLAYDEIGNLVSKTDPAGFESTFEHNNYNQITFTTDPLNNITAFEYDENRQLTRKIEANGAVTENIYAGAKLIRTIDPEGGEMNFTYDEVGNLIEKVDKNSNITTIKYDAQNRPLEETDPLQNSIKFAYDANGNVTKKTDKMGHEVYFTYDMANRRTTKTDPAMSVSVFKYDANGRLVMTIDALAQKTAIEYDVLNRITKKSVGLPDARISSLEYDALGRVVKSIDPMGNYTLMEYDANGNPIKTTACDGLESVLKETVSQYDNRNLLVKQTDPLGNATNFEYDAMGRLAASIDPLGNRTEFTYDEAGNLIKTLNPLGNSLILVYNLRRELIETTNALGKTKLVSYDLAGKIVSTTDEEDNTTTIYYDALNRKIGIEDPDGNKSEINYDANSNVVSSIDHLGNATQFEYDNMNRKVAQTNALEFKTTFEYDPLSRLVATIDAKGAKTQFVYNAFNEKTKTINALGQTVTTEYDSMGRVITTTNARGIESVMEYDALGRLAESIKASGTDEEAITRFSYDKNANLIAITNAENGAVQFEYDKLNRRLKEIDADGSAKHVEYDPNGNLVQEILRNGTTVTRKYDLLDRLTEVEKDGTAVQEFEYDVLSRMTRAVDFNEGRGKHVTVNQYDIHSRMTSSLQDEMHVNKAYDANSNLTKIIYPSGKTISMAYNPLNLLTEIYDSVSIVASYSYDENSRTTAMTMGNGAEQTKTYNDLGLEETRSYELDGESLYAMESEYDKQNNVVQETILHNNEELIKEYTFDNLDRLIEAQVNDAESIWKYDLVGNWVFTNQNKIDEGITVNADNEYTEIGTKTPYYDANGNMTSDGVNHYVYDWNNRLVEVKKDGQSIAVYTFDALNRRKTKTLNSVTTTYVYDGGQVIEEYKDNQLERSCVYGTYIDDPVKTEFQGEAYYYVKDRLYSVTAILNNSGEILETYEYSSFGLMTVFDKNGNKTPLSAIGNPYGYTGRRWDAESSLWYYRNRMYSASLGRFLQRDPAGYVDGLCLYAYVKNNPLKYLDAWGLSATDYAKDAAEQVVYGNYTDKVNLGGTVVQIGLGVIGVDLPMDMRDLYHSLFNFKLTLGHVGTTALNGIGLLPVVGVVKNVAPLFKKGRPKVLLGKNDEYIAYEKGGCGITGMLDKNGMLSFLIEKGPDTPSGGQMFNEMMEAFGSNVEGIKGAWLGGGGGMSSNYDAFKAATARGVSESDAALNHTFTGVMAQRHGFNKVRFIQNNTIMTSVEFYK